jgi:hypothetical protein
MSQAYEPLKKFVARAGGIRLSTHPALRDQLVEWAVEDFPIDAPPERMEEVLAARLRLRSRDKYGSVIAAILISVLAQLIVKAIVAWWLKRHSHRVLMIGWQEQASAKKNPDLPS